MSYTNKVAVITGASRGLGAGMAEEFSQRGLRLGLCARGPSAPGDGELIVSRQLDVTDAAAVEGFAAEVAARFGHIDLWINNAGVLEPIDQLRNIESGDFRRHLEVNVLGVFHGTRAYVRHIRDSQRDGVLLNISSGAARSPYSGWSAYCAAKAAVDRMTEVVALEEADSGLRAHAVAPGIIDTGMQELIRGMTAERFPLVERFRQLKDEDAFATVESVAVALLELAFDPAKARDEVAIDLRQ